MCHVGFTGQHSMVPQILVVVEDFSFEFAFRFAFHFAFHFCFAFHFAFRFCGIGVHTKAPVNVLVNLVRLERSAQSAIFYGSISATSHDHPHQAVKCHRWRRNRRSQIIVHFVKGHLIQEVQKRYATLQKYAPRFHTPTVTRPRNPLTCTRVSCVTWATDSLTFCIVQAFSNTQNRHIHHLTSFI